MAFDKDAFDLFAFLGELNRRNLNAYTELSPEGQKAAHPLVIQRWLSGTSDSAQIVRLNMFSNKYVFTLGQHKPLLFKLLAAACTGSKRNQWIKGPGGTSTKLSLDVIKRTHGCSTREAAMHIRFLKPEQVLEYGEELGLPKEELKKLSIELGVEIKKPVKVKKK